jgi:EAL domain-containing protein (putative c-di-GMP-specific phosphodiesterase class I)
MEHHEPTPSQTRRRVLVIDDEASFCSFMARIIEGLGYDVQTASQFAPSDCAALTESDLIFIDMKMPGTDGIQVLDILSRYQVRSSLVLMSGEHGDVLTTAETIAKRSGLRVLDMLHKPFRSADVRRILENAQEEPGRPVRQPISSDVNIEDIVAGLERREFDAYLQPIVDLATSQPVAYEALARWRSERFALLLPGRFIAMAARHGILPRISHQILNRALSYAAQLKENGMVWKVAVNLGAEDLLDSGLPEKLAEMLAAHRLPPHSLIIELMESSATANEIMMLGILARLRLKGIELAIDDFGTSYSGFDRLSTIPFTILKIDMRFISAMRTNSNARAIVESSIALAKRLNMKSVAEGIESETQLAMLKEMRCDYGQGYFIAHPMDFPQLLAWNKCVKSTDRLQRAV